VVGIRSGSHNAVPENSDKMIITQSKASKVDSSTQYLEMKKGEGDVIILVLFRFTLCGSFQLPKRSAFEAHVSKYPIVLANQIPWGIKFSDLGFESESETRGTI
jgi:hypothetical protein